MRIDVGYRVSELARAPLRAVAERRFARSAEAVTRFFDAEADAVARACLEMARRFERGGRLLVFGEGAQATDAHHVAVEFVHPVLVGKRALPAIALTCDVAALTGAAHGGGYAGALEVAVERLGRAADIAMGIGVDARREATLRALGRAREMRMLTLALVGEVRSPAAPVADFLFAVRESDALVVQEVHETLCHVLWELVHVFFESRVADAPRAEVRA